MGGVAMPDTSGAPGKRHGAITKRAGIEQRRAAVLAGIVAGLSYDEIAEQQNCSKATVAADWKRILAEWKESHASEVEAWRLTTLSRLESLYRAVNEEVFTQPGEDDSPMSWKRRVALLGRLLDIIAQEIRLMGLSRQPGETPERPMYVRTVEIQLPPGSRNSRDDDDDANEEFAG